MIDVLAIALDDLFKNFVPFLLVGVAPAAIALVVGTLGGFAAVALMLPGLAKNDLGLAYAGMFAGVAALALVSFTVTAPLNAGLMRTVNAWLADEGELEVSGPVRRMLVDVGSVYALTLLVAAMVTPAALLCYFPAFVVATLVDFALPAVVVHRLGPIAAIRQSVDHARRHFLWHLGFWGLGIGILIVAGSIPLVGTAIGMPLYAAYTLRVYRIVFGSGEAPSAA